MSNTTLHITLFGKFTIWRGTQIVPALTAHKLQELFGYLLLYRDRQHPREVLADQFWGDLATPQARTHLRKALWEIQDAINDHDNGSDGRVLLVDSDWVQIDPGNSLWLDVAEFEHAFHGGRDVPGEQIDESSAQHLQAAVELYRGDLLEGWYHDWCLYERERLQQIYLSILDKLMGYCEVQRHYEQGIDFGTRILRYDRAHEQTHRRLMRLHFLAGDRTGALRQYERCARALQEELGVTPTEHTMALSAQIKANQLDDQAARLSGQPTSASRGDDHLANVLTHLRQIQTSLDALQQQVSHEMQAVAQALETRR